MSSGARRASDAILTRISGCSHTSGFRVTPSRRVHGATQHVRCRALHGRGLEEPRDLAGTHEPLPGGMEQAGAHPPVKPPANAREVRARECDPEHADADYAHTRSEF